MANGDTWDASPESFIVKDGRVFLFHDSVFYDAKAVWQAQPDEGGLIDRGDEHWRRLTRQRGRPEPATSSAVADDG